ncbi:MAG: fatty acid desaturase [Candidatus Pacebacteria bacterium]|jgi:omega-6 fatty acid desaturase (delta-12 desaturase)|nr:fatty acid desaturase [Candidatus Paceibacterota bacterium]
MNPETSHLYKQAGQFAKANTLRSYTEIVFTLAIYFTLLYVLFFAYTHNLWLLYIPICLIAGFIMVKIFTLLHDCTHHSLFNTPRQNHVVGVFLSLFITMPFTSWKAEHDDHHSHVVDIDRMKHGDVTLYTVEQFKNLPWYKQLGYTIFRHPVFLLVAAPFLYFFVKSRIPSIWTKPVILSVVWTNIAVAIIYLPLVWYFGFWTTVFVFVPAAYIGGIIGVALFYLQHDYPGVEWFKTDAWEHSHASLAGSSLIILPQPLEWFSHAIGYHHIHHLNSKVPGYRLRECYDAVPDFQTVKPLTWSDVVQAFKLKLWSHEKNMLVNFSEAKKLNS